MEGFVRSATSFEVNCMVILSNGDEAKRPAVIGCMASKTGFTFEPSHVALAARGRSTPRGVFEMSLSRIRTRRGCALRRSSSRVTSASSSGASCPFCRRERMTSKSVPERGLGLVSYGSDLNDQE